MRVATTLIKKPETCGIAYTYVNGVDKSPHGRGHNVVVVVRASTGILQFKGPTISLKANNLITLIIQMGC